MISLDDRRRLYVKAEEEKRYTSYGSISYQIREANEEASGFFDFMGRALAIVATSGQSRSTTPPPDTARKPGWNIGPQQSASPRDRLALNQGAQGDTRSVAHF
ncbi:hypothetical protein IscW_ISCW015070 [Ixodes scapularis]|uniref:Uncharacterized protein n=1 Tax=Ixodes scapularis TaxID=6945 RepID=B7QM12_IXOSC|nr:hypothetical protein IscW_ISCW015070 [Ixodes scapularis]|eukprot:XP_002416217.1 hypothetical protein IscW_ISCW015070 [Ixodes scapularis]